MKLLFLLVFLITQNYLFPQNQTLDGFLGIKWGVNSSEVIKQMKKKEVKIILKNDTLITMMGGSFAGRKVFNWQFLFFQHRFYAAAVLLEVSTPIYLDEIFTNIRKDISNKYGQPSLYDSANHSHPNVYWKFNKDKNQKDDCFIYLTMKSYSSFPFFSVLVAYQNNFIFNKKINYEKIKKRKSLNEL